VPPFSRNFFLSGELSSPSEALSSLSEELSSTSEDLSSLSEELSSSFLRSAPLRSAPLRRVVVLHAARDRTERIRLGGTSHRFRDSINDLIILRFDRFVVELFRYLITSCTVLRFHSQTTKTRYRELQTPSKSNQSTLIQTLSYAIA
jgi:hypothetical protein